MSTPLRHTRLALRPLALASALALLGAGPALALPQGQTPAFGQTQVQVAQPGQMVIEQRTPSAGIDWRSFSIAAGESVRVVQPSSQSVLFNRVSGNDPSAIFGSLQANGRVYLSNPRGIVFGQGSQVDVGGLVATTLSVVEPGNASGRLVLAHSSQEPEPGALRAEGSIRAPGGTVALVAPQLKLTGNIEARRIGLGAFSAVSVDVEGDGLVFFNARNDAQLETRLDMLGRLRADGGVAEVRAAARAGFADTVLNLEGVVQARGLSQQGGRVLIGGGPAGVTRVAGQVDVSGERGGHVEVLGDKVLIDSTAHLDATGRSAGGTVLVGGNWQGQGPQQNASRSHVAAGAVLDASATGQGDGGTVVVWSDLGTRFLGTARADAGAAGGDGGRVEVSGKAWLDFRGAFSARAMKGLDGLLLLDPEDIDIADNSSLLAFNIDDTVAGEFTVDNAALATNATLFFQSIENALAGGAVVVRTSSGGNITVKAPVAPAIQPAFSGGTNLLTLQASGNVVIEAGATLARSTAGGITLTAGASGSVVLNGNVTTAGGAITMSSGTGGVTQASASTVNAGAGTISVNGGGAAVNLAGSLTNTNTGASAIGISNASTLALGNLAAGAAGTITLSHSAAGSQTSGTVITSGALVKAGVGTLTLSSANTYTGSTQVNTGGLTLSGGSAIANAGAVVLANASGVVLTLSASETIGSLAGGGGSGGNVVLGSTALTVGDGASTAYAGVISGTAAAATDQLIKEGSGTLTLSGPNTYSGRTVVNAGGLTLAGGNAIADTGTVHLTNVGGALLTVAASETLGALTGGGNLGGNVALGTTTLTVGDATDKTYAGVISGTAAAATDQLIKQGSGTLTLTGANNFSGATQVAQGGLQLGAGGTTGSLASTTIAVDGTLLVNRSDAVVLAHNIVEGGGVTGGNLTHAGTGALSLTPAVANTYTGTTRIEAGQLTLTSATSVPDTTAVELVNAATANLTLNVSKTIGSLAGGGSTGGNVVLGGNTLTVGNASSTNYGGAISGSALVGTDQLVKQGGGTLTLSGTNTYSGRTAVNVGGLTLAGGAAIADAGTVVLADAADAVLTLSASETIGALAGGGGAGGTVALGGNTLTVAGASSTAFAGAITGTLAAGTDQLVRQGSGTLTLSGTNTYTGRTLVSAGGLTLAGGSAIVDGGAVQLANAGTAVLTLGASETIGSLAGGGALGGNVVLGVNTLTLNNTSSTNYGGAIGGTAAAGTDQLVKQGSGNFTLSGTNSYSGRTVVNAGGLTLAGGAAIADGGAVVLANATGALLTLDASETIGSLAGGGTLGGNVVLAGHTLTVGDGNSTAYAGAISGTASAGTDQLVKHGGGTLTLSGANTYSGRTQINAGGLTLAGGNAIANTGAVQLADVATAVLTLSASETLGSLAGGGSTGGNVLLGSHALTVGDANDASYGGVISGTAAASTAQLVKQGSGTLTLTGANTYTGTTQVAQGVLQLGAGGTSGSLASATIAVDGTLRVERSDAVVLSNNVVEGSGTASGNFTHAGAGALSLSPSVANTYAGTTRIEAGQLTVTSATSMADSTAVVLADAAAANLTLGVSKTIGSLAGGGTLGGNVVLGVNTLTVSNSTSTTYAGVVSGTAAAATSQLVKQGAGTLTLTGTNTFTGATHVAEGNLQLGAGGTSGSLDSATIAMDGTLRVNRSDAVVLTHNLVEGSGSSSGNLTHLGTGALSLAPTVANTYSGTTRIEAGPLLATTASALPSGTAVELADVAGASLVLSASQTIGSLTGGGSLGGDLVLGADTLTVGNASNSGFSGVISGTAAAGTNQLVKQGSGTLTLSGANTYSGRTVVNAGGLTLAGGAAIADTGAVVLANAAGVVLTLNAPETLGSLAGGGNLGGNVVLSGHALTLGDTSSTGFAGVISGTAASATNQLIKQGSGTLTLSGVNTYTGRTVVNAGGLTLAGGAAIANAGTVLLADAGGVVLTLNASETLGTLAGGGNLGGNVALGANTLTVGDTSDATYAGVIGGSAAAATGQLVKQGSGTLTLTGASTFTGATQVAQGSLQLGSGGTTGSLASTTIAVDGTLRVNRSDAVALANNLAEGSGIASGNLTHAGTGALSLSPSVANTYTGTTLIEAGLLTVTSAASLADSTAVVLANVAGAGLVLNASETIASLAGGGSLGGHVALGGNTLTLGDASSTAYAGVISGTAAAATDQLVKQGTGTLTLTGANTFGGATRLVQGGLQLGNGGASGSVQSTNIVLDGTLVVNRSDAVVLTNNLLEGSGAGSGSLTHAGTGTLTLSPTVANTYAGATRIEAGPLLAGAANALPSGTAVELADAATAALVLSASQTIGSLSGGGSLGGNVALGGAALTVGNTTSTVYAGAISGTAASGTDQLIKQGSGTLTLSGANTYSGRTLVNAGGLTLDGGAALADNGAVALANAAGALLTLNAPETLGALAGGGSLGGNVALGGHTLTLGDASSTTYAGTISGTAAPGANQLVKQGSGTLTLGGTNSYSGRTVVNAGGLTLAGGQAIADTGAVLLANAAGVVLAVTTSETLGSLAGGGSLGGNVVLGGSTLTVGDASNTTYSGVISGTAAASTDQWVKQGSGTLTLAGANTYSGRTLVNDGTLALLGAGRLPDASAVVLDGATLALGGVDDTVAALTMSNGATLSGAGSLSAQQVTLGQATVQANLGAGTLTKTGNGTVATVSGALAATVLVVDGGTLDLASGASVAPPPNMQVQVTGNGAVFNIGSVSFAADSLQVSDGGTLAGTGTLSAPTTLGAATVHANLGGATLAKQGDGTTATLNGTASAGNVSVTGGTLAMGAANRLSPAATVDVAGSTAVLALAGHDQTVASLSLQGGASLATTGSVAAYTGTLTTGTATLEQGTLAANLAATHATKQGSGTVQVQGLLTADQLDLLGGSLALGAADLLSNGMDLRIAGSSSVLNLGAFSDTVGALTLAGGGQVNGTGTLTAGTLTLEAGTVNANLAGTSLVKQTSGTVTLNGQALAPLTRVTAGTLALGADNRLSPTTALTLEGGTAVLNLAGFNTSVASLALKQGATLDGGGTLSAGTVTAEQGTLNAPLQATSLTKQGTADVQLNAAANVVAVEVNAGGLVLGASNLLADGADVVVNGNTARLVLGTASDTVRSLTVDGGARVDGTGTLTAGRYQLKDGTVNASLGLGALEKSGTGTLNLNGHADAQTLDVLGGRLVLAQASQLNTGAAVTLNGSRATLDLGAHNQAVASLALQGGALLDGSGTLSAGSYALTDGHVVAALGAGSLAKLGDAASSVTLSGTSQAAAVQVNGGTLVLSGANRLLATATVTLNGAGSALDIGSSTQQVGSLVLQGGAQLTGTGTLQASTYRLEAGSVDANLGTGVLEKATTADVTLNGNANAQQLNVAAGRLLLGPGSSLAPAAQWAVASGATLALNLPQTATALAGTGTVDLGGTTLTLDIADTATTAGFDGVLGGAGNLVKQGAGTYTLRGDNTYSGTTTVGNGTLVVGDGGVRGSLGTGAVAVDGLLRFNRSGVVTVPMAISGTGGVAQAGVGSTALPGTLVLTGTNTYSGTTTISSGELQVGDGGNQGSLGSGAVVNDGVLRFQRSDAVALGQLVSGSGAIEQNGAGTLTISSALANTGALHLKAGNLVTVGDHRIADASAVHTAANTHLTLGGDDTVASLTAGGPVTLRGSLATPGGAQAYGGVLTLDSASTLTLSADSITARKPGNALGSQALALNARTVNLSAGVVPGSGGAADRWNPLTLGAVNLSGGGTLEAGSLNLTGNVALTGGATTLIAHDDGAGGAVLAGKLALGVRPMAIALDTVRQSGASAITTTAGASLTVQALGGGSIALLNEANDFSGGISALAGAHFGVDWTNTAGSGTLSQARADLRGTTMKVTGIGIDADIVALHASRVVTLDASTGVQSAIRARLPFIKEAGAATQLPGLTFTVLPAARGLPGRFGTPKQELALAVATNSGLANGGGYVTVLPADLATPGETALFTSGLRVGENGYRLFYDGAGKQQRIPIIYNSVLPVTPQVQGTISATVSVSESARKERFDEAVRTENVAIRLRAGVVAEVGPGRPATQGVQGMRPPPTCVASGSSLSCGNTVPASPSPAN